MLPFYGQILLPGGKVDTNVEQCTIDCINGTCLNLGSESDAQVLVMIVNTFYKVK